jgi:Family of unknown function (DUF6364)
MKNVTVSITEESYRRARVFAAQRNSSLSAMVEFLLENLPTVSRAVAKLIETKSVSSHRDEPLSPTPPKTAILGCETADASNQ